MKLWGCIAFALLAACAPTTPPATVASFDDRRDALAEFVKANPLGSSRDVWLTKNLDDRVALIFGYVDDYQACLELADAYMKAFPVDKYHCTEAN